MLIDEENIIKYTARTDADGTDTFAVSLLRDGSTQAYLVVCVANINIWDIRYVCMEEITAEARYMVITKDNPCS